MEEKYYRVVYYYKNGIVKTALETSDWESAKITAESIKEMEGNGKNNKIKKVVIKTLTIKVKEEVI